MYKVLHYFVDLQDNNHPYNAGDVFPREGLQVTEARLAELSGPNNLQRKPLLVFVEEAPVEPAEEAKEEAPKKAATKRRAKKSAE